MTTELKKCIVILSLIIILPLGFIEANTNQYGATYDDTIPIRSISFILDAKGIHGKILSFKGEISAQCKGDGCWFKLKDGTGEILVDLKPYDFRTPLEIVGRKVKLNGKVNKNVGKIKVDAISVILLD